MADRADRAAARQLSADLHAVLQDCTSTAEAMMRDHLDLLFEQHLSRLVACCVYGTTRKHNVVVSIKVVSITQSPAERL